MSDFEQLLSSCEDASQSSFKDSEEFSNWLPVDGVYNVVAKGAKFKNFTSKRDQRKYGILALQVEILDGPESSPDPENVGKSFEITFFGNSNVDNGQLKKASRLLGGDTAPDYGTAVRTLLPAFENQAVASKVQVTRKAAKDNPDRIYENVYIQELTEISG